MSNGPTQFRDGKIVRSEEPLNLEMPFEKLDGFITPTESFYVRTHFPIPKIDKKKWRLRVEGEVEKPFEITFDQLIKLQSCTIPATLECAGNNRDLLEPKVKGVQWGLGAVGNAEWTGVPLSILLDRAGVKSNAREIILEGADEGPLEDPKAPRGNVRFARSIPLAKAREDVLLAYRMNDVDLTAEHGFPVRAVVPGWYAVASIKWLQRIIVTDKPFNGYYQTLDYAFWKNNELVPLSEMQIKAEIAQPADGEVVSANSIVRVHGAAWTSGAEITKGRNQHRWRIDMERDEIGQRIQTKCVAALGIQLAHAGEKSGEANTHRARHRFAWPNSTAQPRSRSRHLHDQSSAADHGGSSVDVDLVELRVTSR